MRRVHLTTTLAVLVSVSICLTAWAGMSQSGPLFNLKSDSRSWAPPSPAPGGPGGAPGGPASPNMQMYMEGQQQARELMGKPAAVEREKTAVTLELVAKYGDEEDKELRRYQATFSGRYTVRSKEKRNPRLKQQKKTTVVVYFPFPTSADTVPDATLKIDGKEPKEVFYRQDGVSAEMTFEPEQMHEVTVSYRAFGTDDFVYTLDRDQRTRELDFKATIKGTQRKPELPPKECLEPSTPLTRADDSYSVAWTYSNLVTTRDIIVHIPAPMVGSDVAHRMPNLVRTGIVSLILFGMFLLSGAAITKKRLGLGQYTLLAFGVVMFYPLLLHLSKYLSVYTAFGLAFLLMAVLVLGSLSRGLGRRFAFSYGLFGLVAIVGLFSTAALMTKGAGTLITIGIFVLVAYLMWAAPKLPPVRLRPSRPVTPPPPPPPAWLPPDAGETAAEAEAPQSDAPAAEPAPAPVSDVPAQPDHCAFCGRAVEDDFAFCPGCGKSASVSHDCPQCGYEICDNCRPSYQFCPGCGRRLSG